MSGEDILFCLVIWCAASVPLAVFAGNIMGFGAAPAPASGVRPGARRAVAHDRCALRGRARTF
jgi:hypothetical protein